MSRVRASSQGARRPPPVAGGGGAPVTSPPGQLSLEDMRQRMLMRRNVDHLQLTRADLENPGPPGDRPPPGHQPLFVGRSLVISNSPPHPSNTVTDAADPHKLFQMLRKKKRTVNPLGDRSGGTPTALPRQSPDRSEPHPSMEGPAQAPPAAAAGVAGVPPPSGVADEPQPTPPPAPAGPSTRPQAAGSRPANAAPRHAFSAGAAAAAAAAPPPSTKHGPRPREASSAAPHSAHAAPDGRPCTRQKLPSQSLDLFPGGAPPRRAAAPAGEDGDPFPKPAPRRVGSGSVKQDPKKPGEVDFNCLFVSGDGDLGGDEVFPSPPKAHAGIPLIETEWFSASNAWEAVPIGGEQAPSDAAELEDGDTSHTLYELLVATKGRRSAKQHR